MSTVAPPTLPVAGDRLGGHVLCEEIGRGGTGVVYRAIDEPLGRVVAIKVLDRGRLHRDEARLRLQREAAWAAAIAHPNVLPVYRADDDRGRMFITMQYVAGGSLSQVLAEQGPPPIHAAVDIIHHVARGLDAAHAAGLVHGDVKPQNMLIEPDGHVWLADFCTVRPAAAASSSASVVASPPARSVPLVGTLDYMAPEQIRGDAVGPAADVYALACVAYRLLVGHVPFPRDDRPARRHAHLTADPPDAHAQRPAVPPQVSRVVQQAMAKDPARRPDGAGAFAAQMREALDGADGHAVGDVMGGWGPRPGARIGDGRRRDDVHPVRRRHLAPGRWGLRGGGARA